MKIVPILVALFLSVNAQAILVTAFQHEFAFSGSFGVTVDPNISNLPNYAYPLPSLRGGSFEGIFVYDSFSEMTAKSRFPFLQISIAIFDNNHSLISTINSAPNDLFATANLLQLRFGPSIGVINSAQDLRLTLNGGFTLAEPPPPPEVPTQAEWDLYVKGIVAPTPGEIMDARFMSGFIETDGSFAFTYWCLPVTSLSISHTGSTPYLREVSLVSDSGNSLILLTSAFGILLLLIRLPQFQR